MFKKMPSAKFLTGMILPAFAVFLLAGCGGGGGGYTTRPWDYKVMSHEAAGAPNDLSSLETQQLEPPAPESPAAQPAAQNPLNPLAEDPYASDYTYSRKMQAPTPRKSVGADLPKAKVALLLPLSGEQQKLGQSMLKTAQLALFDIGYDNFTLLPRDTKGTPEGAAEAARSAINSGAQLILGPVFAANVRAAKQEAARAHINMIAFSTDWSLADQSTFMMGFLPFDQVERVLSYAAAHGVKRVGVLAPNTSYGLAVLSAYRNIAPLYGIETTETTQFNADSDNLSPLIRRFAHYDDREEQLNAKIRALQEHLNQNPNDKNAAKELESLQKSGTGAIDTPYDAVLMPFGSDLALSVSNLLSHYDLPPGKVLRLGTGLWDDKSLATEKTMRGGLFAAPPITGQSGFNRHYKDTYGGTPPRLASLSYDATALAAVLARTGVQSNGRPAFDTASITNPNGFTGIDGIFRFRPDGIAERGLAVIEFRNGRMTMVEQAPTTFQSKPTQY